MSYRPTDTSEKALEALIVAELTGHTGNDTSYMGEVRDYASQGESDERSIARAGGAYVEGSPDDYDREHAADTAKLLDFLNRTQPEVVESLSLADDGPGRQKFLHRLQGEVAKRGIIDVLRKGVKHGPKSIDLFYGMPTPGNTKADELFRANIFSVTRQLRYSKDETRLALDMVTFINGLPFATFELKNNLTKQTAADAVEQYEHRDSKELLFQLGRCAVHFVLDDQEVQMCTHLEGTQSWFLPFNKGFNDGAGNPPNPDGLKTDYLWKRILAKNSLTNILENYAQVVEDKGENSRRKKRKQIFPRYHQLDVVLKLLADAKRRGAGKRYLIQHSAGSGKSNSIAWLAHQLIGLTRGDPSAVTPASATAQAGKTVFDSVIVVTDRRLLDKQIKDTIKQFAQVSSTVGHHSP